MIEWKGINNLKWSHRERGNEKAPSKVKERERIENEPITWLFVIDNKSTMC